VTGERWLRSPAGLEVFLGSPVPSNTHQSPAFGIRDKCLTWPIRVHPQPGNLQRRVVVVSHGELVVSHSEHTLLFNYIFYITYYISLDLFLRVEHEYNEYNNKKKQLSRGLSNCQGPLGNPEPASRDSPPARAPAPPSAVSDNASSSPRTLSSPALAASTLALALPHFIHNIYIIRFVFMSRTIIQQ
jgi:hypothetical protein